MLPEKNDAQKRIDLELERSKCNAQKKAVRVGFYSLALLSLVLPFYLSIHPVLGLGLALSSIVPGLVYYKLKTSSNNVLVWLRPFTHKEVRPYRFHKVLNRACDNLFVPITIQDSSFRTSHIMGFARLWWLLILIIPFLLLSLRWVIIGVFDPTWWFFAVPVGGFTILVFLILYPVMRRIGYTSIDKFTGDSKFAEIITKIRRRAYYSWGVTVLKCEDEIWQARVIQALKSADMVLIDISNLSQNIIWETEKASQILPTGSIAFAFEIDWGQEPRLPVTVYQKLQEVLPTDDLKKIPTFFYPKNLPFRRISQVKQYVQILELSLREFLLDSYLTINGYCRNLSSFQNSNTSPRL